MDVFSSLAAISTWLTPTVLFCFLNAVVATIFIRSSFKPNNNNQETHLVCPQNDPVQFFRSPSLLDRVKSFSFSRTYPAEPFELNQHAEPEKEPVEHVSKEEEEEEEKEEEEEEIHVARTVSDSVVESVVKKQVKRMKKSQSAKIVRAEGMEEENEVERERPATMRERNGTVPFSEDEAVDAKADDFINRFKQQLKLQRIESLLKYRGGGASN